VTGSSKWDRVDGSISTSPANAKVWHELRQVGAAVRAPDVIEEAQLVCDHMASRARQNVEVIVTRLAEQGYRFHANDDDETPVVPHHPPGPDSPALAAWLQARFDMVPLTLLSWVRLVGDVWLVGTHPLWTASASADPLVIEVEGARYPGASITDHFDGEYRAHQRWASESTVDIGPFVLPVAPDRLHKDNVISKRRIPWLRHIPGAVGGSPVPRQEPPTAVRR
jgi:hypothetical protein